MIPLIHTSSFRRPGGQIAPPSPPPVPWPIFLFLHAKIMPAGYSPENLILTCYVSNMNLTIYYITHSYITNIKAYKLYIFRKGRISIERSSLKVSLRDINIS